MQCSMSLHRSACKPFRPAAARQRTVVSRPVRSVVCQATAQRQQQALSGGYRGAELAAAETAMQLLVERLYRAVGFISTSHYCIHLEALTLHPMAKRPI